LHEATLALDDNEPGLIVTLSMPATSAKQGSQTPDTRPQAPVVNYPSS